MSDLLPDQTKTLNKPHKMAIIKVSTITTTLSIGSCTETTSEDVACEESDDKFTIFVSNAGGLERSIHLPVCAALSRLLKLDMMTLFTCMTHPVDMVSSLFEYNGVPELRSTVTTVRSYKR